MDADAVVPTGPSAPDRTGGRRPLHVVFVVDASGSMTGERMASLNWAAKAAVPAIREASADHPGAAVLMRVLRFADGVDWPVGAPTPVESFAWATLEAGGETAMGTAFAALAGAFAALDGEADDHLPPAVILLSDGMPTDDIGPGLLSLLATKLGAKANRIAIAIGSDADLEVLQAFIADPAQKPLRASNAEMLAHRLRWAATSPLERAGEVSKVAPVTSSASSAEDDLVW